MFLATEESALQTYSKYIITLWKPHRKGDIYEGTNLIH
jgi:hypothetical protein